MEKVHNSFKSYLKWVTPNEIFLNCERKSKKYVTIMTLWPNEKADCKKKKWLISDLLLIACQNILV